MTKQRFGYRGLCASIETQELQRVLGNAHSTSAFAVNESINTWIDGVFVRDEIRALGQLGSGQSIHRLKFRSWVTSQDLTRELIGFLFMVLLIDAIEVAVHEQRRRWCYVTTEEVPEFVS